MSSSNQGTCQRCGGGLEKGFAIEHTTTNLMTRTVTQHAWHSGTPTLHRLGTVDLSRTDLSRGMPITMYRCNDCGFLEMFARRRQPG